MQTYVDDDDGYEPWLGSTPLEYVVDTDRPPGRSCLRLHR
jgi:hypothetical protein